MENDSISRSRTLKILRTLETKTKNDTVYDAIGKSSNVMLKCCIRIIELMPANEQTATWEEFAKGRWRCSKCGHEPFYVHYVKMLNYCPNCGRRMEVADGKHKRSNKN